MPPLNTLLSLWTGRVKRIATMQGHTGSVICIAISPNGKFMASGGVDGIKIWDLKTKKEVSIPQQSHNEKGQVSSVCWITRKNEAYDTLCYGNALGFLVFLQHRPTESRFDFIHSTRTAKGGEIVFIAANVVENEFTKIAISGRDKCLYIWKFDPNSRKLEPILAKGFAEGLTIVPKTLAFDDNVNHDIFIFGLYDGGLYKYSGKDAQHITKYQLGSQIGNAAVNLNRRECVIDSVGSGFELYTLDSGHFLRSFRTREALKTYPKGVAFANSCNAVIGGSDHGLIYIFDVHTGDVLKKIKHCNDGGVETIAVHDNDDGTVTIAAASSTAPHPCAISLWKWKPSQKEQIDADSWTWSQVFEIMWKVALILSVAAQIYSFASWEVQPKFYGITHKERRR